MSRRVHVLLYPGCVFQELAAAVELLAAHLPVNYFTPDGAALRLGNGATLRPDGGYDALARNAPAAVLVPGGDPRMLIETGAAVAPLKAAHDGGAWMAGICAGALVLAHAGLLKGRRATHTYRPEWAAPEKVAATAPIFDGLRYERADLVLDPPFITAMPWAERDYAAAVAQALGLMDADEAARYRDYPARRRIGPA